MAHISSDKDDGRYDGASIAPLPVPILPAFQSVAIDDAPAAPIAREDVHDGAGIGSLLELSARPPNYAPVVPGRLELMPETLPEVERHAQDPAAATSPALRAPMAESVAGGSAQVSVALSEQPGGGVSAIFSLKLANPLEFELDQSRQAYGAIQSAAAEQGEASSTAAGIRQREISDKQRGKLPAASNVDDSGAPEEPFHPARPVPVPWERAADRSPQKLPIIFRDAIGRKYVWPWEKAKTWATAKGLIDLAFRHVEVIGPHVFDGRYDLIAHTEDPHRVPGTNVLHIPQNSSTTVASGAQSQAPAPPSAPTQGSMATTPAAAMTASASTQTPNPVAPTELLNLPTPNPAPQPPVLVPPQPAGSGAATDVPSHPIDGAIIAPGLWEDIIEPGMYITMYMWPMHQHPASSASGVVHPAPLHPSSGPGTRGHGRGRGRGAPRGAGWQPSAPVPPPAPEPPIWQNHPLIIFAGESRGKTRKRQNRP